MKVVRPVIACIVAAGLLSGVIGCKRGERSTTEENRPVVRGITIERVELKTVPEKFEASGTVRARNTAVVSARIPGTVSGIYAREGDRIQRGKLLVTLEALETSAGAAGARYAVEEAERAVDEARTRKRLADVTFQRFERLYKEQAATRQEFDSRKAELDLADQGLARARARLAQAREAARAAGSLAGYTKVAAPIEGIVTAKSVDMGATVFPGMPLMTIEQEGKYRLEVNVPETMIGKVDAGAIVPVVIDGVGDISGRVVEIVPKVDPVSRTVVAKVEIGAGGLRSGMFGRAILPAGEKKAITVPKSSVMERGQLSFVWAVDRNNMVRMRLVKPGQTYDDSVEILTGLSERDRIVSRGMERVADGAKVE